jgi:pimeloyl-ACP methyl ester carboxylesterase
MPEVELEAGVVGYEDSGGEGPVLVLIGGLAMDWRLWREVIEELGPEFRCVAPTMPLGAHRIPMRPGADLSLRGLGRIVAELIERLDLDGATLAFNDWGGAQTMVADDLLGRVGRLVLVSCEAFDNYPPGLAGRAALLSAKLPGGISVMRQAILRRPLRRLPMVYGQMSKRGVPDALLRSWLEPLRRREIQRDLRKYVGDVRRGKRDMAAATASLASFEKPVLVVWDTEGRMMPSEHGRMLAEAFPNATLVELDDCYTLVPIDRPRRLAAELRQFAAQAPSCAGSRPPGHASSRRCAPRRAG